MVTDQRTCLWPGCSEAADCACLEHWSKLPGDIKADLNRTFSRERGMTPAYANALARAQSWILKTFSGEQDRRDPGKWERLKRFVRGRDTARRARAAVPVDAPAPAASTELEKPAAPKKPWRHLRLVRDDEGL